MSCLFCKIIAGEIPCHKIFENDDILAFLDISPVSSGHALVVPKKHFANFEEIDEASLSNLIRAVKKIGFAIKSGLGCSGYNVSINNDPVAGQVIPHLHFHLIPRIEGDGLTLWLQGKYQEGEAEEVVKKLKNVLNY